MSNTFYIFRHGLATKNTFGYKDTIVSASLLPEGKEQARKIGEFLKGLPVHSFYCSEYLRCTQTADIISTIIHVPYLKDRRLNEYYQISFDDFAAQIDSFISALSKLKNQNIFICTHVANIIVLEKRLLNEKIQENNIYSNLPLPGVLQVISGKKLKEIDFNAV